MTRQPTAAVVFDFDGVLVESADIKTAAFGEMYRQYGEDIAAKAVAYHLQHAGISRHVKFRHLHRTLLDIELADEEVSRLGAQFSRRVLDAVVAAPWVAGAREFLDACSATLPLFVASGTPDGELKTIVARRAMARYFRSVHGAPATKGEIIAGIIARHGFAPGEVLVVGDAIADLDGARLCGARFIGRVHGGANLFAPEVTVIPDLAGLRRLLDA